MPPPKKPRTTKIQTGSSHRPPKTPAERKVRILPLAQRYARDSLILQLKAEGRSNVEIGQEVGLTGQAVGMILKRDAGVKEVGLLRKDPIATIEWMLEEYMRSFATYSAQAMDADTPGILIQAMQSRDKTLGRIIELLQATGKLPRELGTLRYVLDFRGIAQAMLEKIEDFRDGKATVDEVADHFRYILRLGDSPMELVDGSVTDVPAEEEDVA